MQLSNKLTCMNYNQIYKAAVLSNHVYMNPKTYIWKNPKSHFISKNKVDCFITPDRKSNDSIYVIFKGASDMQDLLVSASAISEKRHDIMHNAYFKSYLQVHKDITRVLKPMLQDYKYLIFGGHSRGQSIAAAASIFHFLLSDMNKYNHMSCIGFGGPKCINKNIAAIFEDHIDHLSVEHCYDIIPHIPLHKDLVTLPNKLIIGNKEEDNPFDIYGNHSASKYKSLVEALLVPCELPPSNDNILSATLHDDII